MKRTLLFLFLLVGLSGLTGIAQAGDKELNILVFSKTAGYRHASIPDAIKALVETGQENKWNFTFTEDSTLFTNSFLEHFQVIIFLMTSEDVLNEYQQNALVEYVHNGKGLVTIHSGTFTEQEWPWWGKQICCYFTGHPPVQEGKLIIENRNHPSTRHFTDTVWMLTEEFYSFDTNPRSCANVLISIDEDSYQVDDNQWFPDAKQRMGDHPLAWYKEFENGRVFHTALGHESKTYFDPVFRAHIVGAIKWAGKIE